MSGVGCSLCKWTADNVRPVDLVAIAGNAHVARRHPNEYTAVTHRDAGEAVEDYTRQAQDNFGIEPTDFLRALGG